MCLRFVKITQKRSKRGHVCSASIYFFRNSLQFFCALFVFYDKILNKSTSKDYKILLKIREFGTR